MASDKSQFLADGDIHKETPQQNVSMGVKQRRALVSIENILPQSVMVTPEIVESSRPIPPVGNQSVVKGAGGRRSNKRPAESVAIAGTEGSKKRLKRL